MSKLKYEKARDIERIVYDIIDKLNLNYIDKNRVKCIRSYGSKSYSIARIYGLPKPFQVAYNLKPMYVIEVISEKFDKLSYIEKIKVLIHEILHIPKSFSGSLLPHKKYVEEERVNYLLKVYLSKVKNE